MIYENVKIIEWVTICGEHEDTYEYVYVCKYRISDDWLILDVIKVRIMNHVVG